MKYLLKNAVVYIGSEFLKKDILVSDEIIADIQDNLSVSCDRVFNLENCYVFPGFIDVHVHLREPGFSYKETVKSGTLAAAHGGFCDVCCMANLNPAPDNLEHLNILRDIIKRDAVIGVHPYGTITVGEQGTELSDMAKIKDFVSGFSDDGRGVQSDEIMESAMNEAKKYGKIIVAHCENNSLLHGGYIHEGKYSLAHAHKGISSESEYSQIARDIELVAKTNCAYHVCHISTKQSVELIRQAKRSKLDVTCETAPHYLTLTENDLLEDGRFKMNPPLRSESDRDALLVGIADGTIDMIATDHAPHSMEEKSRGLKDSLMGVVGLETSFPVCYSSLVRNNVISLGKLINLMHDNPKKRFNIGTDIEVGKYANLTAFSLGEKYKIQSQYNLSFGKSTPFEGMDVHGKCKITMYRGNLVWQENLTEN